MTPATDFMAAMTGSARGGLAARAASALLGASLLAGCPADGLPTGTITLDGTSLKVEIADTADARAAGLMFRDSLGADRGMVFIYDDDAPRSFWMKDTRIPLSIAYVDAAGKIVRISDMTPLSTESVPSLYPARYAIEVNRGWFGEHGVEVGDAVGGLKDLPRSGAKGR